MVQRGALSACGWLALAASGAAAPHELSARDVDRQEIWRGAGHRRAEQGPLGRDGPFRFEGLELLSWLPLDALHARAGSACGLALARGPSGRRYAWVGVSNGVVCVELTRPDAARTLVAHELPASTARALAADGGVLYTLDARGVLRLFEASDPGGGPGARLAEIDTGHGTSPSFVLDARRARLHLAAGRGGLATYDVADPRTPKLVARWSARYVDSLALAPDGSPRVACAGGFNDGWTRAGVELLDLSDPATPRTLARLEWGEGIPHVVAWDGEGRRVLALDERDAAALGERESRLARLELDGARGLARTAGEPVSIGVSQHVAAWGERLAVAGCRRGLRVLEGASGPEVAWFDTVPTDDALRLSGLWDVAALDTRTLAGVDLEKGLFVWEFSAPAPPAKSGGGH